MKLSKFRGDMNRAQVAPFTGAGIETANQTDEENEEGGCPLHGGRN